MGFQVQHRIPRCVAGGAVELLWEALGNGGESASAALHGRLHALEALARLSQQPGSPGLAGEDVAVTDDLRSVRMPMLRALRWDDAANQINDYLATALTDAAAIVRIAHGGMAAAVPLRLFEVAIAD